MLHPSPTLITRTLALVSLLTGMSVAHADPGEVGTIRRIPPPTSVVTEQTISGSAWCPVAVDTKPSAGGKGFTWASAAIEPVSDDVMFCVGASSPARTDTASIAPEWDVAHAMTGGDAGAAAKLCSGVAGIACCEAPGCDTCGDALGYACCPAPACCPPTFWTAGVEATFLAADRSGSGVNYLLEDAIASPPVFEDFGTGTDAALDSLYVAPRMWIGVQRGCWGLVARYWHLRGDNQNFDPYFFAPGAFEGISDAGYFVFNQLDMYAIDLETTYSFCTCCDVKNTLSFGARYAAAEHTAGLDTIADVNDGASGTGLILGRAYSERVANGAGITGSWFARKPLFPCSCIHVIGGARGSVLWGDSYAIAETGVAEQTPSGGGAASNNLAYASSDDALFIGEVQLGLQWDYRVQCFPADAFFRIVAEYQHWGAGTGGASATSFAGFGSSPNFSQGTATAVADHLDIDLYGFSMATGFAW